MVFELDIKDMERHAVELRLYIDKARRRFDKAQLGDQFEKIVKNALVQSEAQMNEQNSVRIDSVNTDSAKRLAGFLESLVNKCSSPEQHEALQNTLRSSLHQARRTSVLNGSLTDGVLEQICYFCASSSPQQSNMPPQGFSIHNILQQAATMHHQLTPPSSIEGPSPPLDDPMAKLSDRAAPVSHSGPCRHHAMSSSSGQPSPDDGLPAAAQAETEAVRQGAQQNDADERADTIVDSQDSNASKMLQIVLEEEDDDDDDDRDEAGKKADKRANDSNNLGTSKRLSDSGTRAEAIPPSPEENEHSDGAHEDSMHQWFENLNQTALPVQRASTPVSSSSSKSDFKNNEDFIYKRFSDIKYSIEKVKRDQKDLNIKTCSINNRANHSLDSSRGGHSSFRSQQIQSSNFVDNDNDNDNDNNNNDGDEDTNTNFLQTSATQPMRSSLIVKTKPKRGRPKGQNSKHFTSNDNGSSSRTSKRCKVRA